MKAFQRKKSLKDEPSWRCLFITTFYQREIQNELLGLNS